MTLPGLFTSTTRSYQIAWMGMVAALNAVALWMLARQKRRGAGACWWWLGFLALLGPIWIGRLDGIIAPLMLIALIHGVRQPGKTVWLAVTLATLGAWIKIAPGAIVIAIAVCSRRLRDALARVVLPGILVSAIVVNLALAGGAGSRAWGVFGQQGVRGLQVESVAATWFSLARLWNPSVAFGYNRMIFTFEVQGDQAQTVAGALDSLLLAAIATIALLTWVAARRQLKFSLPDGDSRAAEGAGGTVDVLLVGTITLTAALIVFNKVGSPQFQAWFGPCVAAAIAFATPETRRWWRLPGVLVLVIALLTGAIFPEDYGPFLDGTLRMIVIAAARNLAVVALMAWGVWRLVCLCRVRERP
jgi:hypothetical protein